MYVICDTCRIVEQDYIAIDKGESQSSKVECIICFVIVHFVALVETMTTSACPAPLSPASSAPAGDPPSRCNVAQGAYMM